MAATIYSYTVIFSAAEAFKDKTPYAVALIDEDGKRFMAGLEATIAPEEIAVGAVVEFAGNDENGNPQYRLIKS
jgi:uncharacterized OB-fold protein